jgi:hypothetical protein
MVCLLQFNMLNKKIRLIIAIVLIIIVSLIIYSFNNKNKIMDDIKTTQEIIFNNNVKINVEIADDSLERERGLMFREGLGENSGMLFIFKDEQVRGFWMKNMLIPLDMIFINGNGKIVSIKTAEPCKADPCASYSSDYPAKYVLEVNSGFALKNNVSVNDSIEIYM